jgi:hypothetical protein
LENQVLCLWNGPIGLPLILSCNFLLEGQHFGWPICWNYRAN